MIYKRKPKKFEPLFEVAACFCEYKNKILLLHRQDDLKEGNTWCLPSGKIEKGELPIEAVAREVWEETGFEFKPYELDYFTKVYVRYPEKDFVHHMFYKEMEKKTHVKLEPKEHKSYTWKTPRQSLKMNLIRGLDDCIRMFYKI